MNESDIKLNYEDFLAAKENIDPYLTPTPLVRNEWLSSKYRCNVFLKLENLQPVGSFKVRGALNKILNLTEEEKKNGIIAVSAGNHSQGVAYAASKVGIDAKIIMPVYAPLIKVMRTKELGAQVISFGEGVEEGFNLAEEIIAKEGRVLVHPFKDKDIILGQGTIALEILNQINKVDFLFGSIGGGGLLAGISSVLKSKSPSTVIVGSQAEGAGFMVESIINNKIVEGQKVQTFADGIKVRRPSKTMFELLNDQIDEVVKISDATIAQSVLDLMEQGRIVAEGAAAINLASFEKLYQQSPKRFHKKNVVLIISGGNIDINTIDRIIEKGLRVSGRRRVLSVTLPDRPGTLNELTSMLASAEANVLEVQHERSTQGMSVLDSIVNFTLELRDEEQYDGILKKLKDAGYCCN